MQDLITALGLLLVIEGALYALWPTFMRRAISLVLSMPERQLRNAALFMALVGLAVVGLARGL